MMANLIRLRESSIQSNAQIFIDNYIASDGNRFVFGRTPQSENILSSYPVDAIIDDYTDEALYHGIPILKSSDLPKSAVVISAVMHRPTTAALHLSKLNVDWISYYQLQHAGLVSMLPFWEGAQGHFDRNQDRYQALYERLNDNTSRNTLRDVLSFRETGDVSIMSNYTTRLNEMYFEEFLAIPDDAFFYDIGALDGINTRQFFKRYKRGKGALMVEPLVENSVSLRGVTDDLSDRNVILEHCAISDKNGTANFVVDDRHASSRLDLDGHSGRNVKTRSLTDLYECGVPKPDFIKMDIEGAELSALKGAERIIKKFKPAMAVSVYHNVDHILDCFELIRGYDNNYHYYMRHYTEGYAETVLYATLPP